MKVLNVFLLFIVLGCSSKQSENISKLNLNDKISMSANFPIDDIWAIGFNDMNDTREGKDASFTVNLVLKNNTENNLSSFEARYFIEALYQDGDILYYPTRGFYPHEKEEPSIIFDDYGIVTSTLHDNELWKSKSTHLFTSFITWSFGDFFTEDMFKRTPKSLTLYIQFRGISIEKEYLEIYKYDILDYWKDYQTELQLR